MVPSTVSATVMYYLIPILATFIFFNFLQANVDLQQREECKLVKFNPIQIICFGFLLIAKPQATISL